MRFCLASLPNTFLPCFPNPLNTFFIHFSFVNVLITRIVEIC